MRTFFELGGVVAGLIASIPGWWSDLFPACCRAFSSKVAAQVANEVLKNHKDFINGVVSGLDPAVVTELARRTSAV